MHFISRLELSATDQIVAILENNPGFFINPSSVGGDTFFEQLTWAVTNVLLPIAGLICLLFVIYGGYLYIVSGSNEDLTKQAKKTITSAVIGLVIVTLSFVMLVLVSNVLQGNA